MRHSGDCSHSSDLQLAGRSLNVFEVQVVLRDFSGLFCGLTDRDGRVGSFCNDRWKIYRRPPPCDRSFSVKWSKYIINRRNTNLMWIPAVFVQQSGRCSHSAPAAASLTCAWSSPSARRTAGCTRRISLWPSAAAPFLPPWKRKLNFIFYFFYVLNYN